MAKSNDHIDKARHNERFAQDVRPLNSDYLDWVITAYFYAALHYLEAYLAANPVEKHPTTHGERMYYVASIFSSRSFNYFSYLKDRSESARYETRTFSDQEVESKVIPGFEFFRQEAISRLSSWTT